jgi:hypothetical protein
VANFCPHFCRSVGAIMCDVDPNKRKSGNPFEITTKYPVEKEVLLTEYVENAHKFFNYILSSKIDEKILYSVVKQTLLAICVAQRKKFTHYDLHSDNIMMKKCDKDLVFLYNFGDKKYAVPTYGHYPIIIDFGFSYAQDMEGQPMWCTLNQTDAGFMCDRFDAIADPKLFLITVSDEIYQQRQTKKGKILRNITKNLFGRLPVCFETGWDNFSEKSASDKLLRKMDKHKISKLFLECGYECLDIIQSLITLPLKKRSYKNVSLEYLTFLKEFKKIEDEISSPFYCMYILKGIVDVARQVMDDYKKKDSRKQAVDFFSKAVFERIDSVAKYCSPKIDHEKMLCALLCFSRSAEGMIFERVMKREKTKQKMYEKMPVKTAEEMYEIINENIPDEYEYNENTKFFMVDVPTETCEIFSEKIAENPSAENLYDIVKKVF